MSGLPAKIVCQVSGVARLPTGWLMKGFTGESGWGSGGGEERGGVRGGVGPPLCCFNCRPVSGQLLIHSSFTTTTNRGHTRAGQQSKAGQDTGRQSPPPHPRSQYLHCRYRNRAVSKGLAVLLSPSFSFLFPSLFDSTFWLVSPLSLLLPSSSSSSHLLLWNKSAAVSASLWASALAVKQATVLWLQPFVWLLIQR